MSRTKVKRAVKQRLVDEAGGKCANPGCPSVLLEVHHIRRWHVYKTHDPEHMICLCPTCHDAVDRGTLRVTDELAYKWKQIRRQTVSRGHLYVEPGEAPPNLLLGSVAAQGTSGLVVFHAAEQRRLSFRIVGSDIMHLNATVATVSGRVIAEVIDGHYQVTPDSEAELVQRPGQFQVTHAVHESLAPQWALQQLRMHEPDFAQDGSLPLLDMEVVTPNVVRVRGMWLEEHRGLVITGRSIVFLDAGREHPVSLRGQGADTVLHYQGPVTSALFAQVPGGQETGPGIVVPRADDSL